MKTVSLITQEILKGAVSLYCWPPVCMTTDNFCLYLQNSLIQTSKTGGLWYSDTSPFSIPCLGVKGIYLLRMRLFLAASLDRLRRLKAGRGLWMFHDDFRWTRRHRRTDADDASAAAKAFVVGIDDARDVWSWRWHFFLCPLSF